MVSLASSGRREASGPSTPTYYDYEENLVGNGDSSLPYVVQKYGGTSVGKSLDSIGSIVECVVFVCFH